MTPPDMSRTVTRITCSPGDSASALSGKNQAGVVDVARKRPSISKVTRSGWRDGSRIASTVTRPLSAAGSPPLTTIATPFLGGFAPPESASGTDVAFAGIEAPGAGGPPARGCEGPISGGKGCVGANATGASAVPGSTTEGPGAMPPSTLLRKCGDDTSDRYAASTRSSVVSE